jgi:multicomponent Na+:H+ antiporter subunit C
LSSLDLYALGGVAVFFLGFFAVMARAHLLWKVLALNLMGTGVFLFLLAAAPRLEAGAADPVPQAMVLTGIVVSAAATALALGMTLRVAARTGSAFLIESLPSPPLEVQEAEELPEQRP